MGRGDLGYGGHSGNLFVKGEKWMINKANLVFCSNVKVLDSFWNKYRRLVKDEILPYQWEAMNDRISGAAKSHCIENFRIAAGECEGDFYGAVFQDSDLAKWLEAVSYTLAEFPDEKLGRLAEDMIDLIERAQLADGYFNTYFILKEPKRRFCNLREGHELYTLGHMIEAAVGFFRATGDMRFVEIVRKMADLVDRTFGPEPEKMHGMPGHQEIELALVKLFEVTEDRRYLDLAKYFIDVRGQAKDNYFLDEMKHGGGEVIFPELSDYRPEYSQSHLPVRKQRTAEGHAVRAVYMYCAMADLAAAFQDEGLLKACEALWDNIVEKRMFITGGIGSSGLLERFTTDYDLPNDYNYSESCASIGLALFSRRMMLIKREAKYADIMERALYNTVLAGIAMDGKSFFYVNPLEVWPDSCMEFTSKGHVKSSRQKWFGVACCPSNIARTLASFGEYIYAWEDNRLFVNLFVANRAKIPVPDCDVDVEMQTNFPWDNRVWLSVKRGGGQVALAVRIPDYARDFRVWLIEGGGRVLQDFEVRDGYACFVCEGAAEYEISFVSKPRFVRANPKVRADAGKVCMMYGPLVYALEEADNGGNLGGIFLDTSKEMEAVWDEELLQGTLVLKAAGKRISSCEWNDAKLYGEQGVRLEDVRLTAIPYAYWNNRGEGEMTVWIKELMTQS